MLLTIDNSDGALPIEYAEVTISRTMFRSGGSEYAINGSRCRLLDVQELLSDSGIGREMHVIVGQGQLDTILHATPEDRRGFIEEAAGVLKHRKRKEKALRKLDSTDGNLTRLGDLLSEIRRQLKPLGRQAEVGPQGGRRAGRRPRRARPADRRRPGDRPHRPRAGAGRRDRSWSSAGSEVEAASWRAAASARRRSRRRCARTCRRWPRAQETWFAPVRAARAAPRHPVAGRRAGAQRRRGRRGDAVDSGRDPDELEAEAGPGPRAGDRDRRRGASSTAPRSRRR